MADDRILDGESLFGCPVDRWWQHARLNTPNGPLARFGEPRPLTEVSDAEPLLARVYEGSWIVDCPCGGADFAWLAAGVTMCGSCGNMGKPMRGKWRRFVIAGDRRAIERHLLARPVPATRNWLPGETMGSLIRENAAMLEEVAS